MRRRSCAARGWSCGGGPDVRLDRRFLLVLGVSLVWALLVTAFFARVSRGGSRPAQPPGGARTLVVAARALPMGSVVSADAVRLRNVPDNLFPAGGFSRVEDVA